MFFNKRKDGTKCWQPEDDVAVTEVSFDPNGEYYSLRVAAVYKGNAYSKDVSISYCDGDPDYCLERSVDYAKRLIVNEYRYQDWQRGMRKAVSSYPVTSR